MRQIIQAHKNCWAIAPVEKGGLLVDARCYFYAFAQCALRAEYSILICGWQFDTDARLLDDEDARRLHVPREFLPFLNHLCDKKPNLHIYILAWDFHPIYAYDRQWLQEWRFGWKGHERIHFCFDSCHPVWGSHHQKVVVIDGWRAFVGGIDICKARWDDRCHQADDPRRVDSRGKKYPPKHDIQGYVQGPAAARLAGWFKERWHLAKVKPPLKRIPVVRGSHIPFQLTSEIKAPVAAFSQTSSRTLTQGTKVAREIEALFKRAIMSAERLIYIENQYLNSDMILKTFENRMKQRSRAPLQIVIMLPRGRETLEMISIVPHEIRIVKELKKTALAHGHALGVYQSAARSETGKEVAVQIHSKLLLVDDRFISVGSANLLNRSFGLDTELMVSWEARGKGAVQTEKSIREARIDLLSEHTGLSLPQADSWLGVPRGLVRRLDYLALQRRSRLRRYSTSLDTSLLFSSSDLVNAFINPDKPFVEGALEEFFNGETISEDRHSREGGNPVF